MKILITHVYSRDNAGDAAILSVLISELKKQFREPAITISTMENLSTHLTFENFPLVSSFTTLTLIKRGRINLLINAVYVFLITLTWSHFYKLTHVKCNFLLTKDLKILLNTILNSEIVIPVGGGYLRGENNLMSNVNLFMLLFPLYVSKVLGKKIFLYTQSIGPFGNKFQSFLTKYVLNTMDLIILRENISVNLLRKIGIEEDLLMRSVDAGFLFDSSQVIDLKKKIPNTLFVKKGIVGITVRQWLSEEKQDYYERQIALFSDYLIKEKNMFVVFIPQVTVDGLRDLDDDREISKSVVSKMDQKENVWIFNEKFTHYEIKALYANLDYIVGTRFHSVIFSLTSFVPAIAIEYEYKTRGIMQDLGLAEYVIRIESVDLEQLIEKFNILTENRKNYIEKLKKVLPSYAENAKNSIKIIKKMYEEGENN